MAVTGFGRGMRSLQHDGWHMDLLRSCKLVFSNDALVPVGLAFNAVLEHVPCLGEEANDFEEPAFCSVFLIPIRRKPNCLANRKFMGGHLISQHNVRCRLGTGAAALLCAALLCSKRNRGRLALLAALHLVAELLALVQIANSRAFDGRNVHEHVLRAIVGLDEAVALLGVEPLYGSSSHCKPFKEDYAAPAFERRSNFGTERKASSVLDTSEENGTPNHRVGRHIRGLATRLIQETS